MIKVNIFDTSIGTLNLGDEIIVDAIINELAEIFNENTLFYRSPTHEIIGLTTYRIIKASLVSIVAGTCLLNSRPSIFRRGNWKISIFDALNFKNVVLMGVGWGGYQRKPNLYAKVLYKLVLSKYYIHSVRDNYTKEKLNILGINNVVNTGCPTMWKLTNDHCMNIPHSKAENVIATLTDYNQDRNRDKILLNTLCKNYKKVYFWVQGSFDYDYIKSIFDLNRIIIVPPKLTEFDKILESNISLDYVGTRLHAGIRAMQKSRRSIIISIDNRATEIDKDFSLNVIHRNQIENLDKYINSEIITSVKLDINAINLWKNQFKNIRVDG